MTRKQLIAYTKNKAVEKLNGSWMRRTFTKGHKLPVKYVQELLQESGADVLEVEEQIAAAKHIRRRARRCGYPMKDIKCFREVKVYE